MYTYEVYSLILAYTIQNNNIKSRLIYKTQHKRKTVVLKDSTLKQIINIYHRNMINWTKILIKDKLCKRWVE